MRCPPRTTSRRLVRSSTRASLSRVAIAIAVLDDGLDRLAAARSGNLPCLGLVRGHRLAASWRHVGRRRTVALLSVATQKVKGWLRIAARWAPDPSAAPGRPAAQAIVFGCRPGSPGALSSRCEWAPHAPHRPPTGSSGCARVQQAGPDRRSIGRAGRGARPTGSPGRSRRQENGGGRGRAQIGKAAP